MAGRLPTAAHSGDADEDHESHQAREGHERSCNSKQTGRLHPGHDLANVDDHERPRRQSSDSALRALLLEEGRSRPQPRATE
jgi:hypothetical protein